jgi:hypothetical protein
MEIIKTACAPEISKINNQYHILTFAETGFAMLNFYGNVFDVDNKTLNEFSEVTNQKDESGSLFPVAPISIVPQRYIRTLCDVKKLKAKIVEFLKVNQEVIHAKVLLFDFRSGVAPFVIQACESALDSKFAEGIEKVLIISEN